MTYIYEHMRPIIEQGHFYVSIPPLYSIIEKGKKRYFIDQEEYDEYIYKKILSKYSFITKDKKVLNTIKKISIIISNYNNFLDYINTFSNSNIGLTKDLLIDIFDYCVKNGATVTNIKKFITDNCDINVNGNKYEGFYKAEYIFFEINDLKNFIAKALGYVSKNNIPIGNIYYKSAEGKSYSMFTIQVFNELIKEVTPKSRCRMKGKPMPPIIVILFEKLF